MIIISDGAPALSSMLCHRSNCIEAPHTRMVQRACLNGVATILEQGLVAARARCSGALNVGGRTVS